MNNNYPSASQAIRNLNDIRVNYEVVLTEGFFRVIRFDPPFFDGYEFWVVNERGFLWEAAETQDIALDYLMSDEAKEYLGVGG
jgi:hypothetical protein